MVVVAQSVLKSMDGMQCARVTVTKRAWVLSLPFVCGRLHVGVIVIVVMVSVVLPSALWLSCFRAMPQNATTTTTTTTTTVMIIIIIWMLL